MIIRDTDMTIFFIGFFVGLEKYGIDVFYNRKFQKWLIQYSTDAEWLNSDTEQFQFNEDGFITNVKFTPFENSIALLEVDFIEEEFRRLAFFDLTKLKSKHIRVLKTYERYLNKRMNQSQQFEAVKPNEVKKEFKDFFNSDVNINVIQSIQKEFKDYKGKKMAHLIYLLHKDFNIITYGINSRTESRKHFVSALKGYDFRMAGIDKYFELNDVKLKNTLFASDPDFIDIKEKLSKTI